MKIENKEWIKIFTDMEQRRFSSLEHIKNFLSDKFPKSNISLGFKDYEDDDYFPNDYKIVCEIQGEDYLIDLDLYFLYDRKNMIYITEFGVEEE
jgi:hypothetical protein